MLDLQSELYTLLYFLLYDGGSDDGGWHGGREQYLGSSGGTQLNSSLVKSVLQKAWRLNDAETFLNAALRMLAFPVWSDNDRKTAQSLTTNLLRRLTIMAFEDAWADEERFSRCLRTIVETMARVPATPGDDIDAYRRVVLDLARRMARQLEDHPEGARIRPGSWLSSYVGYPKNNKDAERLVGEPVVCDDPAAVLGSWDASLRDKCFAAKVLHDPAKTYRKSVGMPHNAKCQPQYGNE